MKMNLDFVPARVVICFMIFSGCLVNYTVRVNLSVSIVAMVPVASNSTEIDGQESLGWSAYERAHVLGGYFWGYIGSCLCGGAVSEHFGPRLVVFVTTLVSAILTLVSPAAANRSYLAMMFIRIALGFFAGFMFPAAQGLTSHWAVPFEKGKFVGAMIGGTIGTVVAWSLCGVIIDQLNWEWTFYVFGITTAVWCTFWWFCVYDTPEKHPRILPAEKRYITEGITGVSEIKPIPPYVRMFTSIPMWALIFLFFGNGWGAYFIINAAPTFISNVLGYNLSSTGFLSSIIYLARSIGSFMFGYLSDFLLERKLITLHVLRKSFCLLSHIIPGFFLVALTFTNSATTSIVLIVLSMAMNGAVTVTNAANAQDLSPNFAGSIYGIANAFSTVAGILTPLVVAFFTEDDETSFEAWRPVFYTGASVYIGTAIIFIIFGSTELQSWNKINSSDADKEIDAKHNNDMEKINET